MIILDKSTICNLEVITIARSTASGPEEKTVEHIFLVLPAGITTLLSPHTCALVV